jgi:hypothetical protein
VPSSVCSSVALSGMRPMSYNAAGCMTRVAQFLVHALFALNEEYFVSDKYADRLLEVWPPI